MMISYVDKIVDMRRNLVMLRGEFPAELQKTFSALETNGNPWNITRMDRGAWSAGLDVPLMSAKPDAARALPLIAPRPAARRPPAGAPHGPRCGAHRLLPPLHPRAAQAEHGEKKRCPRATGAICPRRPGSAH